MNKNICIIFLILLLCSCGGDSGTGLEGEWEMLMGDTKQILNIADDGTWGVRFEKPGDPPKKEEKKKNNKKKGDEEEEPQVIYDAKGKWKLEDEKDFSMTAKTGIPGSGWEKDLTRTYQVLEVTPDVLKLKSEDGMIEAWLKVKPLLAEEVEEKPAKADASIGEHNVILKVHPFVVNLQKVTPNDKNRYLFVEFHLEVEDPVLAKEITELEALGDASIDIPRPKIHPRVKEQLLLFLSTLSYTDVGSFKRVEAMKLELESLILPYTKNRLRSVKIANIVVTSKKARLKKFMEFQGVEAKMGDEILNEDLGGDVPAEE